MAKVINRAMLIDDEELDLMQYSRILERSGLVAEVISFPYADEALAHLNANPGLAIDVIFLDIHMPRMDGFEFLTAAQEQLGPGYAKIVVAMLTMQLSPENAARTAQFDALKQLIHKPLATRHIEDVVSMLAATG